MADSPLLINPVFTALTRPAMVMGVTLDYMMLNFITTLCVMIAINHPAYLLLFLPIHLVGWLACKYDPNLFRVLLAVATCNNVPNHTVWGCRSYEPY